MLSKLQGFFAKHNNSQSSQNNPVKYKSPYFINTNTDLISSTGEIKNINFSDITSEMIQRMIPKLEGQAVTNVVSYTPAEKSNNSDDRPTHVIILEGPVYENENTFKSTKGRNYEVVILEPAYDTSPITFFVYGDGEVKGTLDSMREIIEIELSGKL